MNHTKHELKSCKGELFTYMLQHFGEPSGQKTLSYLQTYCHNQDKPSIFHEYGHVNVQPLCIHLQMYHDSLQIKVLVTTKNTKGLEIHLQ